jgi:hypothetical protein
MIDRNGKLLQGFSDEVCSSLQMRLERRFQLVVTVAILKRLNNIFLLRSSRNAM